MARIRVKLLILNLKNMTPDLREFLQKLAELMKIYDAEIEVDKDWDGDIKGIEITIQSLYDEHGECYQDYGHCSLPTSVMSNDIEYLLKKTF